MTTQVYLQKDVDEYQSLLYSVRRAGTTFSKAAAAKIVGGRYHLERLVREKKIRMEKPGQRQNSTWECNGEDVLRNAFRYAY